MGEEYSDMTPDTLIIDEGQKSLSCPWQSNSVSMNSSVPNSWNYGQLQAMRGDRVEHLLQNADSPFDQTKNWSSTESPAMYQTPNETEYRRTSTMVLEHLEPETINKLISVLVESKGPVKMRLI